MPIGDRLQVHRLELPMHVPDGNKRVPPAVPTSIDDQTQDSPTTKVFVIPLQRELFRGFVKW